MPVRPALVAAATAVLVALAGCSVGSGTRTAHVTVARPGSGDVVPQTSDAPTPGAPTAGSPTAGSPTAGSDAPPVLTLEGDGLDVLAPDGSVSSLAFGGASGEAVQQVLADVLGPTVSAALSGCPQGPRTALQVDGFTALLDGDTLVGWTDHGAPDRSLTTQDGMGIGSRADELTSAVPDAQVSTAPDATTTFAGPAGLAGVLSGADPSSVITTLSAGQSCPGS